MIREKYPALLTIEEYDFMWGLLALQDQGAKILMYLTAQAANSDLFPNGYTHTEALQMRLKYHRHLENSGRTFPDSSTKKSQEAFDNDLIKNAIDLEFIQHTSDMLHHMDEDDSIPALYRPATASLAESKAFRQKYAVRLDEYAELIEENGVLITPHSEDVEGRRLLYAPLDKNFSTLIIRTGSVQRQFLENALSLKANQKNALERFRGINLDIQPN